MAGNSNFATALRGIGEIQGHLTLGRPVVQVQVGTGHRLNKFRILSFLA